MAGLAALALVVGLSGLTPTPAAAVEDTDHVTLPTTGYAPEVVAASGTGIILAAATEDSAYRVSADAGHTFHDLAAPAFTGQVGYVGEGKVMYTDPTGDTDDNGDFFDLYTYDFTAGTTTAAPVKVYTSDSPKAVSAHDVVVIDVAAASGFSAVHLANGQRTTLDVPDRGNTPSFSIDSTTALAASNGFLDSVPLSGATSSPLAVPGLAAARLSGSRAYWIQADGSSATLCFAVAATLTSPSCRTLDSGDHSATAASLEIGNGWVVARLVTGETRLEYVYLSGTNILAPVTPASGMRSLMVYGRGDTDTPLATVLTADGGYIGTYAAGAVTELFDLPQTTATTSGLFVTPQSVSGLDNRPAAGISGAQAWTRPLEGVNLQTEQLLSPRATGLSVSGDRALIAAPDGAHLLDAGQAVRTLAGVTDARSLSGPYFLSGSTTNADVMRVDGTTVLASAADVVTLFGSMALREAGAGYEVVDVTQPSTRTPVDFTQCSGSHFEAAGLWGDWVLAKDTDSGDAVVLDFRHPAACHTRAGAPVAIGDGFALVGPTDPDTGNLDLVAWNFLNGHIDLLASNPTMVATDGSHTVAWTTGSQLWAANVDDTVTPSAPRVLGVLVAPSVAIGSPWTLDLDATKGLRAAGLGLVITNAGGDVVRRIPVPASPNGSVHDLTWDGMIDGAPAPAGAYTWELNLKGSDTGAALVNTDGSSTVAGTLTVTGTLPAVTGVTPTLSAVVGSTISAVPASGAWKPADATFGYQWFLDSVALYGEVHPTYTPVHDDHGRKLSVAVTGSAPGHTRLTLTSAQATVEWPPVTGATPTLSTTVPIIGKRLSAVPGSWAPAGVSLTYQWYRGSTALSGETKVDYTPVAADLGHALTVAVTGSAFEHTNVVKLSAPSALVTGGTFTPTVPVLSNTRPAVEQTVTAIPGTWGTGVVLFTYKWYRVSSSGKTRAITGATDVDYKVSAKDVGYKLKVKVAGTGTGSAKASLYSKVSSKVKKATFAAAPTPKITGTAQVGQKLTAVPGTYAPQASLKYQWYRGTKAIKKATAVTYLLKAADLHKVMKLRVTATRPGYVTVVRSASSSAVIAA